MRTRTDPYASGAEQLATELSGELARLRYQIAVILDYLNGHAPDGATTNAITPTTALAANYWYMKLKQPMLRAAGCRLYKATAFSLANSATPSVVTLDTERYDLCHTGGFSASGAIITIPTGYDGIYHIGASIGFPVHSTGTTRTAQIVRNATTVIAAEAVGDFDPTAATAVELTVSCDYKLAAGDTVALWAGQDSGAAMNVTGPGATAGPEMWVHLIGYGA